MRRFSGQTFPVVDGPAAAAVAPEELVVAVFCQFISSIFDKFLVSDISKLWRAVTFDAALGKILRMLLLDFVVGSAPSAARDDDCFFCLYIAVLLSHLPRIALVLPNSFISFQHTTHQYFPR